MSGNESDTKPETDPLPQSEEGLVQIDQDKVVPLTEQEKANLNSILKGPTSTFKEFNGQTYMLKVSPHTGCNWVHVQMKRDGGYDSSEGFSFQVMTDGTLVDQSIVSRPDELKAFLLGSKKSVDEVRFVARSGVAALLGRSNGRLG